MEKSEVTKEMLVKVAEELNILLGLKPPIVTEIAEGASTEQLEKDLIESCELIQPSDVMEEGTVQVLAVLGVEAMQIRLAQKDKAEKSKSKPSEKKSTKEKGGEKTMTKEKVKKAQKEKKEKGPGVLATILDIIEKKGPVGIDKIHAALVSKFPDREAEGMLKTVKVQLGGKKRPLRIERDQKVKLEVKEGQFTLKK